MQKLIIVCAMGVLLALAGCSQQSVATKPPTTNTHSTAAQQRPTVRFVILSDRTGGHIPGKYEKAVAEANLLRPDFFICVGDLIEGYTEDEVEIERQWQEWEGIAGKLNAPFYYVAGNHDVIKKNPQDAGNARKAYIQRFGVNGKTYYSFNQGGCHFIVLDSIEMMEQEAFHAEQLEWLKQDIAANAEKASHIFIFYHYPIFTQAKQWSAFASVLPKGKTTIFNGHTHTVAFAEADQVPTYVLAATGAQLDEGPQNLGNFAMYAQVTMNSGKPEVALVPVGAIKPGSYAKDVVALRAAARSADIPGLNSEGGTVELELKNSGTSALEMGYEIGGMAWSFEPKSRTVKIAPGSVERVSFKARPMNDTPGNASLTRSIQMEGTDKVTWTTTVPVSYKATLGELSSITCDGDLEEWASLRAIRLDSPSFIFSGKELWRGPADSSCRSKAALVGDKLAIAMEVSDDQLCIDQEKPWEMDAVEICWDVRSEKKPGLTSGAGQIAISPSKSSGKPHMVVWIPAAKESPLPEGVQVATRRNEAGYTVEVLIPTALLGLDGGTLKSNSAIDLAFVLEDRDLVNGEGSQKRFSSTGTGEFWRNTAGYARFRK